MADAGTYSLTAELDFPSGLTLEGAGQASTILNGPTQVSTPSSTGFALLGAGSDGFLELRDLTLRIDNSATEGIGGTLGADSGTVRLSRVTVDRRDSIRSSAMPRRSSRVGRRPS